MNEINPTEPGQMKAAEEQTPALGLCQQNNDDTEIEVITGEVRANARVRCRIIRHMTSEMFALICERAQIGRDSRRYLTHTRHIAMYVCHATLGLPIGIVAAGFGFDRTTVSYACQSVEQRRDDAGYDEFVSAVERVAVSIFGGKGGRHGQGSL